MGVTNDSSEFRYLADQARTLSITLPPVERVTLPLSDGRTLSALRFGNAAPSIVLLHGAGLHAHTWDATALLLGDGVLAIDLAGHGDSSWRDDAHYEPALLAEDVAAALRAWTTEPVLLVGQSLGGLTATAVAARWPELVRELVIVDITPGIDATAGPAALKEFFSGATDFATRDEAIDRALAFGLGGTREETARGVFLNTRVRTDGRVEWKHHLARLAGAVFDPDARRRSADSGWSDLVAVRAPLTLVRATHGFVSAADAEDFTRRVPSARIVEIDASHNVQETAPRELATLLRNASPSPDVASSSITR